MTGGDGVDAYLARRQFGRNPLISVSMAPFVEAYSRAGHRVRAHDRAEVDDAAAVSTEPLGCLVHSEKRPENVDVVVKVTLR
jgi:hypothetical protein